MVELNVPATKADIENAIFVWLDLWAEQKYHEAFNFTLHDPYYGWSPASLEEVINGYGLPYEDTVNKCVVTNRISSFDDGSKHYKEITFFETPGKHPDGKLLVIGEALYDLPIDGNWSDLTASFKIIQSASFIKLELNEIHVF